MADEMPPELERHIESVGYYLLKVHQVRATDATMLDGQIERLGAGEKARFASASELLTLIEQWRPDPP